MTDHRNKRSPCLRSSSAALGILLAAAAASLAPSAAHADGYDFQSPTAQYLSVRGKYPPQSGTTLDRVAAEPHKFRGMTLELEGRLSGIVRSTGEDGSDEAMLMLATERFGTVSLTMSSLPKWVSSGERLRVLVVVTGGEPGTVEIGIPPMEVVAVASALDLASEQQYQRQRVAAREAARKRSSKGSTASQIAKLSKSLGRGSLSSRSTGASSRGAAALARGYVAGLSPAAQEVYPAYCEFIQNHNPKLPAGQADLITRTLLIESERLDMDPRLMIALFIAESDFDPNSTSHAGAMGIGQLMPGTARDLGLSNPYDPVQNVAGSIWLLKSHLHKYSGGASKDEYQFRDIALALAAYNAGPGAVKKYKGVPPYRETQKYVRKVTAIYKALCGGNAG